MQPLTEPQIRAAFVNCTKGEVARLALPRGLTEAPWEDLDYLGWRDPRDPARAYLVAEIEGRAGAIAVRRSTERPGTKRPTMCSLCLTPRSGGVALMVARRAGASGQRGNTVGTYICDDLACSAYVRGTKDPGGIRYEETLTPAQKSVRLQGNLAAFVAKVAAR